MVIKLVDTKQELLQILELQSQNLVTNLSSREMVKQGFVTVKHTVDELEQMNATARHVIAKVDDEVVGYALVMHKNFRDLIPILSPMFEVFEKINYKGKNLSASNYYVMGQICVRDDYRRKGIFKKLYDRHRLVYSNLYDYCVTEVSALNKPSLLAHKKIGFQTIHTYTEGSNTWHILLWELK